MEITCNLLKAREKSHVQGTFGFASHWLKNSCEIIKVIARRGNRSHTITFDSHLKSTAYVNPLTAELALRALIDFTLSNARRFYSSRGNPLAGKRPDVIARALIFPGAIKPYFPVYLAIHPAQSQGRVLTLYNCPFLSGYLANLVMVSVYRRILLSLNN